MTVCWYILIAILTFLPNILDRSSQLPQMSDLFPHNGKGLSWQSFSKADNKLEKSIKQCASNYLTTINWLYNMVFMCSYYKSYLRDELRLPLRPDELVHVGPSWWGSGTAVTWSVWLFCVKHDKRINTIIHWIITSMHSCIIVYLSSHTY